MSFEGEFQEEVLPLSATEVAELDELNDWLMDKAFGADESVVESEEYKNKRLRCDELMARRRQTQGGA